MIPRAFITHWRSSVPWALDEQVEQDLVISRALVELERLVTLVPGEPWTPPKPTPRR